MEPEKAHPEFGPVIICPTEAIDFHSAWILRREITNALGPDSNGLIVSLEEVPFLDSTGLGVLVGAMKRARGLGTSLHIVCPKESIRRIFRVTGLGGWC
jgi:anti-sigma B factor antagonist